MIKIHVNGLKNIYCNKGDILFDVLVRNNITFIGNCGGMGRCNACMVYDEINSVYIKSCKHEVIEDMEISLNDKKPNIVDTYITDSCVNIKNSFLTEKSFDETDKGYPLRYLYGIAIDVGTTTIAMELVELNSNKVFESYSAYNSQICHGADVISRISYGSSGDGFARLRSLVLTDIYKGIMVLTKNGKTAVEQIVIAGNTTMLSIIEGHTLENLAAYPFAIKNRDAEEYTFSQLFGDMLVGSDDIYDTMEFDKVSIVCLPNISAFVGSDVASGAYTVGIANDTAYNMLIDLGTNGEIILANNKGGYATSCACGPAFESCFRSGSIQGTSLFDMLAILRKRRIIDSSGLLKEPYFSRGYNAGNDMVIDMELIHNFLLAKAAIGAGIQTLIKVCGINENDIRHIYISGGFGFHLNIENAIYLGMFPESFRDKAIISGNTSLAGARYCLSDKSNINGLNNFINSITPVNMGDNKEFNKRYVDGMSFPD